MTQTTDKPVVMDALLYRREALESALDHRTQVPYWAYASYYQRYSPDWRTALAHVNAAIARRLINGN